MWGHAEAALDSDPGQTPQRSAARPSITIDSVLFSFNGQAALERNVTCARSALKPQRAHGRGSAQSPPWLG